MDAGAEVIVLDDSSDASSGCGPGSSAATTPATSPAVPRRPAQSVGYASAVEAALAMADGCVTTGKMKKKEKRAAPAPPLLPWKSKKYQTAVERKPKTATKGRHRGREPRRALESSRPRQRSSSSSCSSSSDSSSSSSLRARRRPNFRASARSEVLRQPKCSSGGPGGTAGWQEKERRSGGVNKPRQRDQRRRIPVAPQGAAKKAVEVVDLLSSSSSSSDSSIGRHSRSSSISSHTSFDDDLPAPSAAKSGKKRLVLNERVLRKDAPRPVLHLGQHPLNNKSAFRPPFSSHENNRTAHGDKRKRVLPGMRRESSGSKRGRTPESQLTKKKMIKQPSTNEVRRQDPVSKAMAPLSILSTSSSSASSSPASSPMTVPARKSATTSSTSAASKVREGETDAFGRYHCQKSVSSGTVFYAKAVVLSPASTSSHLSSSPSPRKRRRVANRFNADNVALDELQAQDRELAWIRQQHKQALSRPHHSKLAAQKQKASREVINVEDHSDSYSAAHSEDGQRSDGPQDRTKLNLNASVGAERSPTLAFNSVMVHPTSYRGIRLDEAPISILATRGVVCTEPFQSDCDHPLTFYDETGTLASQCSILENFGKPTQCISSVFPNEAAKPQSEVTRSVGALVTAHLPIIRRCHERKVQAILAETRQKIAAYQDALKKHERDRRKTNVTSHLLPRTTMEKHAVKKLKSTQHICSLSAGSVSFQIGRGDSFVREKSVSSLIQINRVEMIEPMRLYTTSIGLRANCREEDDPILRYTITTRPPGSDGATGGDVAKKYGLQIGDVADEEVVEYVLRLVVGCLGDSEQVFHALKSELAFPQAYTAYSELKKLHDSRQRAIARLDRVEELSRGAEGAVDADIMTITNLMEQASLSRASRVKALSRRLQPPIRNLESSLVDSLVDRASAGMESLGLRATDTYSELVDVFSGSFCRMCYTYACHEHGGDHPLPARRVDPVYPRVRSILGAPADGRSGEGGHGSSVGDVMEVDCVGSARQHGESGSTLQQDVEDDVDMGGDGGGGSAPQERRQMTTQLDPSEYVEASHVPLVAAKMQSFLSTSKVCSKRCWKSGNLVCTSNHSMALSAAELGVARKLRETMGDNSCLLAAVIGSASCTDLHDFITMEKRSEGQGLVDARSGRRMRNWKVGRRLGGSNHELLQRTRNQRLQDRGTENHEYQPCAHEGMCDSTGCSCMKRDHMCEKACACSRDCPNRFEGCACRPGECRTSKCPCFAALRECDPDACLSCGASEVAVVGLDRVNHHGLSTCDNVNVVRSNHKRLGKSNSSIHGYGMYAREAIAADEFVYEYTGAMLSQDEAERRGLIYDRMETSYLFDLNEDAVLDALRCGNKSKFINHEGETPNCTAKVVSVCGVHHITIWARRAIAVGEELVFDYGYKRSVGPDWSQKRAESKDATSG